MITSEDKNRKNTEVVNLSAANIISKKSRAGSLPFIDNRSEAISQRKLHEVVNNSIQAKQYTIIQKAAEEKPKEKEIKENNTVSNPVQRVPMDVQITGITHFVRPVKGSIFEGEEYRANIVERDIVTIEPEDSIWSRRGPNQEDIENRKEDAGGPQIYEWYLVEALNKNKINGNYYLRDETFIVPNELVISSESVEEGEEALKRSLGKKPKDKPEKPVKNDKMPQHVFESKMKKYEESLKKWEKQNAGNGLPSLEIVLQSIGTTFEDCAFPFIRKKHPNATIYNGLKLGSQAELDFVIIQGEDVIIYSSKLNPSAFKSGQDLAHWKTITSDWGNKECNELVGPDLESPPGNPPLVLLVSAETFGLDSLGFLTALVPDWKKRLGYE